MLCCRWFRGLRQSSRSNPHGLYPRSQGAFLLVQIAFGLPGLLGQCGQPTLPASKVGIQSIERIQPGIVSFNQKFGKARIQFRRVLNGPRNFGFHRFQKCVVNLKRWFVWSFHLFGSPSESGVIEAG